MPAYLEAVNLQVKANEGRGGWYQGPLRISDEMAEEAVDITAWGRGFDGFDLTPGQREKAEAIFAKAGGIWTDIRDLRRDLEQRPPTRA